MASQISRKAADALLSEAAAVTSASIVEVVESSQLGLLQAFLNSQTVGNHGLLPVIALSSSLPLLSHNPNIKCPFHHLRFSHILYCLLNTFLVFCLSSTQIARTVVPIWPDTRIKSLPRERQELPSRPIVLLRAMTLLFRHCQTRSTGSFHHTTTLVLVSKNRPTVKRLLRTFQSHRLPSRSVKAHTLRSVSTLIIVKNSRQSPKSLGATGAMLSTSCGLKAMLAASDPPGFYSLRSIA